ncbi:hypothetical protein [Clostridium sp. FP1]|uniref:hypothetical protein n=1 Tax=Clostridium sp. FP1 TaxID=2724076 RepID=UPI0013E95443|nr:hypothetical protein [Clostridium sp. FP1]MBZ9633298.1 hypothetical protein [Clostridium sp. FP1]
MKKNIKSVNTYEPLNHNEEFDKDVEEFLESYIVPKASEEEIQVTVEKLRQYMPKEKKKPAIIMMMKNQVTYINKFYFLASLSLILIALCLPSNDALSYYKYLICSSPISILLGLFELIKSKEEKMWELEKSFKYNYNQIILSRLIIISSFSIIINLTLCGIFANNVSTNILLKLMTTWIAPFSIVASISFLIVSKLSSNSSIMLCICGWIIIVAFAQKFLLGFIESVGDLSLISAIVISSLVFVGCVHAFYKRTINLEEETVWN